MTPSHKGRPLNAGFTPGPWSAHGKAWEVRACDDQMKVCDIRGWGYLTGKGALGLPEDEAVEIQVANARLIAAAPELYEALEFAEQKMTGARLEINRLRAAAGEQPAEPAALNVAIYGANRALAKARGAA